MSITKGSFLAEYKRAFDVTVFAGDDDTDEHAIAVLGPRDIGIKVGAKPSIATVRLDDVDLARPDVRGGERRGRRCGGRRCFRTL